MALSATMLGFSGVIFLSDKPFVSTGHFEGAVSFFAGAIVIGAVTMLLDLFLGYIVDILDIDEDLSPKTRWIQRLVLLVGTTCAVATFTVGALRLSIFIDKNAGSLLLPAA